MEKNYINRIICADPDEECLNKTSAILRNWPGIGESHSFRTAGSLLSFVNDHPGEIRLAVLETEFPDMNGIRLAKKICAVCPAVKIIFLTDDPSYAVDAFQIHASGYLLKPAKEKRLQEEIRFALSGMGPAGKVEVRTFGNFDVLFNDKVISFSRSRAKELLAYLVDRQGSSVSRAEAFAVLWEDVPYDRPMQKQLDVVIRSLKATLKENGIEKIMEVKGGFLRVLPENFDCDLYRFFDGDEISRTAYRGEYMSSYSWASLTEAYLDRDQKKRGE